MVSRGRDGPTAVRREEEQGQREGQRQGEAEGTPVGRVRAGTRWAGAKLIADAKRSKDKYEPGKA